MIDQQELITRYENQSDEVKQVVTALLGVRSNGMYMGCILSPVEKDNENNTRIFDSNVYSRISAQGWDMVVSSVFMQGSKAFGLRKGVKCILRLLGIYFKTLVQTVAIKKD